MTYTVICLTINGLPSIALPCDVTTPENKLRKAGVASWSERETPYINPIKNTCSCTYLALL